YDLAFGRLVRFLGAGLVCLMLAGPLQAQDAPDTGIATESAADEDSLPGDAIGTIEDGAVQGEEGLAGEDATAAELMLPADLSPWGMFMQADIVVKAVMIGLIFASIVTWTIWFAKRMEISGAKRRAKQ